jgi:hypothetical protein
MVLRGSNVLDTRVAGSYNRRPLSPHTDSGAFTPVHFMLMHRDALLSKGGPEGIYGDDDPINSHRPE